MMMKKSSERKWVAIAVAAYLLIMVDPLPSPTTASLHPEAPGGIRGGKTRSPRKALGDRFKLEGATSLDCHVDVGKNKKQEAVKSRSLRGTTVMPPPTPLRNQHKSFSVVAPPPPLIE